ncbi:major capsid protein, partial [Aliivibrio salmonicida]|uniref:major capsid protein n=1 Tax=Aliivibrio salmonicida TaxID=40269 RepID=UPI00406BF388
DNQDLFSVTALTAAVNQVDIVPGRIKALKIFHEAGIATTDFALEYKNGTVSLVSLDLAVKTPLTLLTIKSVKL